VNRPDFCALILTHGRPDRVFTFETLRRSGYTGPIFLVVDDLDGTRQAYIQRYGKENVIVFNKMEVAKTFDQADNFSDHRAIVYARNASFDIARQLGFKYFIQLDDDYRHFQYRFDDKLDYNYKAIKNLDKVFEAMLEFFEKSPLKSIAMAQGGDFIGGAGSDLAEIVKTKRKAMNSFICSVDRPFKFLGRVNEDVNTYTRGASLGDLFLTTNQICLVQTPTQSNAGGMTDLYLESGTYVKSFYTVIMQPSSVKVGVIQGVNPRLHHSIKWRDTVPKILREELRKK